MKRLIGLLIAAAICTGCQSQAPPFDPFLGRTTVPPPGTATPVAAPPYYNAAPTPTLAPAPGSVPPGFSPAPAGGGYSSFTPNVSAPSQQLTPVNGNPAAARPPFTPVSSPGKPAYGPPGGNLSPQAFANPAAGVPTLAPVNPAATAATGSPTLAPAAAAVVPAAWQASDSSKNTAAPATPASFSWPPPGSLIKIVEPTQTSGAATSSNPAAASTRVPEISDLPPAGASALTVANPKTISLQSVPQNQLPGTRSQAAATPGSSNVADAASGSFGYDSQYRWLKGKLEYSQSTRTWRLRYIPPDGATDNYGGSVVIADASKVGGFQPGDSVYVDGTPGPTAAGQGSFAPLYNVNRIQKL